MAENIKLNKEVFEKRAYLKTINNSFSEIGVQTIQEQLDNQPTTEEFFNLYNTLFYQINELGETNSHEFLVKTSGEYISFEEKDELIEALQLEIATLRKELLQKEQELANSLLPESEQTPVSNLPGIPEIEIEPVISPVANIIETALPAESTVEKIVNPDISYEQLKANVKYLFSKGKLENNNENGPLRDLKQAYEKENNKTSIRKYNVWRSDIDKRSSSKDQRDLFKVLIQTKENLEGGGTGFIGG